MNDVIYISGGARSGKSSFALERALRYPSRAFLATAEPFDEEMVERIDKHRRERGDGFLTLEEPVALDEALRSLPDGIDVVLVDCLTVWTGNMMHREFSEREIMNAVGRLVDVLRDPPCHVILVSNEVGMGIVPEHAMARRFRDLAGMINQKVAAVATEAYFLCSGLPMCLKKSDQ
ncbi:bifunctional adenosylcobinamide kinase/adenosylcobinamide-phosphate guanylyltransferase [Prosthecochloris sp. N3]|uniref:Adenosylcobinamide kinase n=1 Tax=Prosthecochloris ethylica TaxID=2743976 RepID=A0ABR9XUG8_9CHLB|nr:bifunctional adenosylcobinamide kinase/adenosylcobinamide-phosphate guanylyltransferase [Prosthecochloris ethylica]MBF0587133.1 bifunctional adenosylcobinamide kinase/adenosylcobinamide-phosphate guanylyltransferase [Prosthecochloris ethylica]MBF0637639.1 bifunctional adenosylcobinamide kinase/adenosylcobinamide-phosphate guanylyltransferase [Prosthecochloris ethylica]NUK48075.1 bifunctional adenosylcobinamide kinase/adenosylcobinamide-phosphate guanylyltransferase [Prosthecochloris ethylica]